LIKQVSASQIGGSARIDTPSIDRRQSLPHEAALLGHSDSRITERVYAKFSLLYLTESAAAPDLDYLRPVQNDR
jgi:hypothetical protein